MNEVETGQTVKAGADRILQIMQDGEPSEDAAHPETEAQSAPEVEEEQPQVEEQEEPEVEAASPTETEEEPVTHFNELADHLNVEEDFLLGLEIPTKVNGEERAATIKDLLSHYQKGESADLKLMDLAESRKKQEAEISQKEEQLQQEWGRLQVMESELQSLITGTDERELDALRHTDPAEYSARYTDLQVKKERARQIQESLKVEANKKTNDQYMRAVELNRQKLPLVIPEWADEGTMKAEQLEVRQYLLDNGISDTEIDGSMIDGVVVNPGIIDPKAISFIRKAMLYDKSLKGAEPKKAKLKSLPKVGSGIRKTKGEVRQTEVEEIRGRVRKTGDMKDAAKAIEQMMMRGS